MNTSILKIKGFSVEIMRKVKSKIAFMLLQNIGFVKELGFNTTFLIILVIAALLVGVSNAMTHETIIVSWIATLCGVLIISFSLKFLFPHIQFEVEIKEKNIAAAIIALGIMISIAIIFAFSILAISGTNSL